MWKYTSIDGEVITGNRQEIAEYLNIHGDIYDDEYWKRWNKKKPPIFTDRWFTRELLKIYPLSPILKDLVSN